MTDKYYWPVTLPTQEVGDQVKALYRGGIYHIPRTALQAKPIEGKAGFTVIATFDEKGLAVGSEYVEDYRGTTIYDELDCTRSLTVSELGPIKEGFTLDKPLTQFDEWIDDAWVTNKSNQHIAEYNQVDSVRRSQYVQVCDPLFAEANIKRLQGFEDDARAIEAQALAARDKIQIENPWPTSPAN